MESIKKYWFWGIFISVLCIFAMSHNANAIDFTYNLNNYELVKSYYSGVNTCNITGGTNISSGTLASCQVQVSGSTIIKSITFNPNFNIKKGDLLEFYVLINLKTPEFYMPALSNFNGITQNFSTLNFESVKDEDTWTEFYSTGGHINQQGLNYDLNVNFETFKSRYSLYKVSQIALRDLILPDIGLDASSSSTGIFQLDANNLGGIVIVQIRDLNVYRFVGSEDNKEVEEKTQEAVDDSQAAGGSSSQDAQTGTTGLLNAITSAVSVISSASPTNCKINGNMGNLDMGQLDLCANPAPAFIQTIGSLILILMCVPLAISLFNRFIAIFRSFQS